MPARHALPAMYPSRVFADLGGLISYGSSVLDPIQRAGIYKILKGANPADLPYGQNNYRTLVAASPLPFYEESIDRI